MRIRIFSADINFHPARVTGGVFYGWWIVGMSVFMLTLMAATSFQSLGIFVVALERKFGWSRTTLSVPFSLSRVQGAMVGPLEGWLIDRLGSRRMIVIGYTIMGIGFILYSQIDTVWQYFAAYFLIAVGSGFGGWLAIITLVNNWFIRRRSMALATAMSGVHLGGFLVPVLALGIESHGFRATTLGVGVFVLATVMPMTWLVRNRPEDIGLRPDGDSETSMPSQRSADEGVTEADAEPEFTARQAMRTPVFWILALVHMTSTISIVTLAIHLVPKLTDIGFSLSGASLVVLTYTAAAMATQFVAGYIGDRMPKPRLIFVFFMFQATSLAVIAFADQAYMAYIFAVLYGIGIGGRIPLLTAIRGDYFGRKAFATIMGVSMLPNNVGMFIAPLFAGYMFDTTGTYVVPFTIFAVLNFVGAFGMLFVRKPKFDATDGAGLRSERLRR